MCKHKHKRPYILNLPTTCGIQAWYDHTDTSRMDYPTLPLDSKGLCIFHSKDRKWKIANHCGERFAELFQVMAADEHLEEMDFREVELTGFILSEATESFGGMASLDENCILFGGTTASKPVRFQGAKFWDQLVLCDFDCTESVDFDEAIFKDVVTVERCRFQAYLSFIGGCRFEHNFIMEQCECVEIASFNEAVFMHQMNITDVQFGNGAIFEEARQLAEDLICQFTNVYFDGYTSFSNGGFNSSVTFDTCIFRAETHFENTVFRKRLQLVEPLIEEKIFFMGTRPGVKLFENAVDFELAEDSFSPAGQIIFQNANLFNFNPAFKEKLRTLELNHQVEIREGCLIYRTSIERVFDYSQLERFLLEDLSRVFTRYFESRHLRTLKVDVLRDLKTEKIRVVFHTDESISITEFEALIQNTQLEMLAFMASPPKQENSVLTDHFLQLSNIWTRLYAAKSLPLLEQFFAQADLTSMDKMRELLNVTINIHLKNTVINSQIEAGGNLTIGDAD